MNLHWVRDYLQGDPAEYDAGLERFIPQYPVQNEVLLEFVPARASATLKVLQVGAGTGVLPYLVLERFADSAVHLVDMTEAALAVARRRLATYGDRVTYQVGHLGMEDLGSGYDMVLSDLVTHQLEHVAKRALYRRILQALRLGGLFVNRDLVLGDTEILTWHYETLWRAYLRRQGLDDQAWYERYHAEGQPVSVKDQLEWLDDLGYTDVGCHWRFLNFAIFGGQKSFRS
jgi:tRNA (cmo5U34)-methyltransferase